MLFFFSKRNKTIKMVDRTRKQRDLERTIKNKQDQIINSIRKEYIGTKNYKEDYFGFIKQFVATIEQVIGRDVNLNNTNTYLRDDVYIIDHDHKGFRLPKPIVLKGDKKIMFKRNHPFFKTDVLYYTNYKVGKIDVFYDATTRLILGYKELNKAPTYAQRRDRYLIVNYSIVNKLKYMGLPGKNIKIVEDMKKIKKEVKSKDHAMKSIISELGRQRIANLQKMMTDVQKYVNSLRFGYDKPVFDDEGQEDVEPIFDEYKNKHYCLVCGDTEVGTVEISYAFKLILDEFKSLCIYPKLTLKTKY